MFVAVGYLVLHAGLAAIGDGRAADRLLGRIWLVGWLMIASQQRQLRDALLSVHNARLWTLLNNSLVFVAGGWLVLAVIGALIEQIVQALARFWLS